MMSGEERRALMTQTGIREQVIPIGYELELEPRGQQRRCCTGGFCAGIYAGIAFGLFSLPLLCCLPLQKNQKYDFAKGAGIGLVITFFTILLFFFLSLSLS